MFKHFLTKKKIKAVVFYMVKNFYAFLDKKIKAFFTFPLKIFSRNLFLDF